MTRATVRWFDDEEGWGVLDAAEVPGAIFVHYSAIDMDGFRSFKPGQEVEVEVEGPLVPGGQDGYRYRARRVELLE